MTSAITPWPIIRFSGEKEGEREKERGKQRERHRERETRAITHLRSSASISKKKSLHCNHSFGLQSVLCTAITLVHRDQRNNALRMIKSP